MTSEKKSSCKCSDCGCSMAECTCSDLKSGVKKVVSSVKKHLGLDTEKDLTRNANGPTRNRILDENGKNKDANRSTVQTARDSASDSARSKVVNNGNSSQKIASQERTDSKSSYFTKK